jgi:hypothetical protein
LSTKQNNNKNEIIYIYFPCIREIWRFVHPRKVARGKYDYFEGEQIFISPLCKGNKCFIPPGQRFGEFCQMKSFGHLCLQNYYFGTSLELIPLYDQSVKSWEFRIREIRYCWEVNTMLLRGKYDVFINITWDCFDQSNFYTSRINIIEWNNIHYCWFLTWHHFDKSSLNMLSLICFVWNGLLIVSHILGFAFHAILLWEIHSLEIKTKTKQ